MSSMKPMKEYMRGSFQDMCMKFRAYYMEIEKLDQKNAFGNANHIYDSVMEPWESLPEDDDIGMDVSYITKKVVVEYCNRELDKIEYLLSDYVKYADAAKIINKNAKLIYDDMINAYGDWCSGTIC